MFRNEVVQPEGRDRGRRRNCGDRCHWCRVSRWEEDLVPQQCAALARLRDQMVMATARSQVEVGSAGVRDTQSAAGHARGSLFWTVDEMPEECTTWTEVPPVTLFYWPWWRWHLDLLQATLFLTQRSRSQATCSGCKAHRLAVRNCNVCMNQC
jgi:hypothetical protein